MEHEMYVPFPVGSVRAALAEPERVVRCVPGLQLDAQGDAAEDSGAVEGRLRVRIGGSTITYRGVLSLTERENGFAVAGEGTEARGSGSVKLALTVVPRDAEDGQGTVLACSGTVRGEGRIAEFEDKQALAVGRRLLDRFGTAFAESLAVDTPADDNERAIPGIPSPEAATEPSAEAAHARRTMIGRSAEEVDHAPPRGRYAPVPAPETSSTTATLRWAAPAAALALATAVVVSRALRRRR
ncbi:carbon monoxide dehydrogenase subunit G [Streptomyces gobiensis]|uniref:carbon monoxide dehydrogenase subunit G n=1 Tax=Streptomyces gobiensis TaxID=2875706 RepID=UPI001E599B6C|nr:carbon monoxide dehydrogenase subunit G [Streptomyces gobiensis]UGY92713.1 carbon monoxide dehydrogenase subunit G [Streptomyces gobiensis]